MTATTATGPTHFSLLPSPIGTLLLVGRPGGLQGVYVADHDKAPAPQPEWVNDDRALEPARRQLAEYFAGERTEFELALEPHGTAWQRSVWAALQSVPYGCTAGYGELATAIGRPTAARAVGAANGRNPISIVIPCHRVIGADGRLAGYGWGPERKAWLLDHERQILAAGRAGSLTDATAS